ncbi:MAG TPA: acyltransferase family protein [Mycobacteriales bacterium]|nr:acyltransferase family protein [Mycobacteriales bacterium]
MDEVRRPGHAVDELPSGRGAFRPEVQALRAAAVAGVVAFHLWPTAVRGGFVGVDVFFVISGFLITQQLVAEMTATGRVSLTRFWARRVRRILPAAVTVLAACVAIVVFAMPRVAWLDNLTQIRAAAAYIENWVLGANAVNYLAAENAPSLVQHYWSLSVEEQFYLAWPLLMLLATVIGRGRGGPLRRRRALLLVLSVTTLVSFAISIWWTHHDAAMAFFATPTRAWEFGVGGLVGVVLRAPGAGSGRWRAAASWIGVVGVATAMFGISRADAFPGAIAAWPVIATAVVIAAQSSEMSWSPSRMLRLRPVQWLGDNSYSVYLWHWPLIIAAPWVTHAPMTWADRLAVLFASLVLAALTKRVVEDPVRRGSWWRARRWPAYGFAATGVAGLVLVSSLFTAQVENTHRLVSAVARAQTRALLSHRHSCFGAAAMVPANHCPRPFARPAHLDTEFAATDGHGDPCLQSYDAATPDFCTLGRKSSPRATIAIVGNSHAWRLVPALQLYGQRHGWQILVATRINCLGLITTPVVNGTGASPNCLNWSRLVLQRLLSTPHLDAVVFPSYRYADQFLEGMNGSATAVAATRQRVLATWSRLVAHGIRVIVPGDVPGMRPVIDPQCLAQSRTRYDPCAVRRSSVVRPNITFSLALAHPELATAIPLTQYFCDQVKCHALIGGVVVYFDSHHLTSTYSRSLARYLGAAVASALSAPGARPGSSH